MATAKQIVRGWALAKSAYPDEFIWPGRGVLRRIEPGSRVWAGEGLKLSQLHSNPRKKTKQWCASIAADHPSNKTGKRHAAYSPDVHDAMRGADFSERVELSWLEDTSRTREQHARELSERHAREWEAELIHDLSAGVSATFMEAEKKRR